MVYMQVFKDEQVDVAIVEVGIGGRFDGTNVIKVPAACGVASIGTVPTGVFSQLTVAVTSRVPGPCYAIVNASMAVLDSNVHSAQR